MANKERTVDLIVRARDQYSKVLANLKKQQQDIAEAGRRTQLQFSTSTRKELAATQGEIKRLAGEFRTLASTQGASRAEMGQLFIAKAKLQAKAGELKASLNGVQEATHRLKVGQQGSFREFIRNTTALNSETAAATQTATALRKVETASNGVANAQGRMGTSVMGARNAMNRGGDRNGQRGENQDVEIYGLKPYQMVNLGYQVNDVISGIAMGQAPLQIFAQQIGQVIQIWPQLMVGLVRGVPILGGLAVAFTPVIAAMVRMRNETESIRYFTTQLAFMADGGRYTAQGLAATTREIQKMGVAIDDARKLALGFAKSGMGQSDMTSMVRMARDLAKITGADLVDTAQKLSKAFRGNVDDVRELDQELQFLTASQLEQMRAMEQAGDRTGALKLAQDALKTSMANARTEQSDWSVAVDTLTSAWDKLITAIENSGVIALAAKGLDLLALSARGAAVVIDEVADVFTSDNTLAAQYGRIRLEMDRVRNEIAAERAAIGSGTVTFGMMGGSATQRDDSNLRALEQSLVDLEAQYAEIVASIKAATSATDEVVGETEEQKKLTLDITDSLVEQMTLMDGEAAAAALTNRERYIEQALLEARNKALERANELGLQFNGLTAEQTAMLREQAGLTFDRTDAAGFGEGFANFTDATEAAVKMIAKFESFRATPYWDVNANRIGFGSDTITTVNGEVKRVVEGMVVSMEDASRDLYRRITKEFGPNTKAQVGANRFEQFAPAQQAALISIAYNYGSLPERILEAVRTGTNVEIATAISGLGGDNAGINRGRREKEANVFSAESSAAYSETALGVEKERLETEKEYGEAYRQRIANQEFEISQASQLARQAAINKAIREEELAAQKAGLTLTQEQRAEIERTTGALFDRQNVEMEVNRLMEQRALLVESLELAQAAGDSGAVESIIAQINETEEDLQAAIEAAIAFWQAIGGPGADAAILKLQNLRAGVGDVVRDLSTRFLPTAESINEQLSEVGSNAFSRMAEAIANGTSVADAFFQTLRQGIADFLIEIGKAIVKQALFNMISGGSAGGGIGGAIGGFITGLFHSGGVIGRGAGSGSRMVNPGVFAGAQRFHGGGVLGLGPNEVPIIGLKDEEMLTRDDPRHILNGGANGGDKGSVKIVNVFDPADLLEAALATEAGEKVTINFMTRRARTLGGALKT